MTPLDYLAEYLWKAEGVESNDPDDRGGHTKYGFTERWLDERGALAPNNPDEAKALLKKHFWLAHDLQAMHPFCAILYADALFNHQYRSAVKCLQAGLGVNTDGILGPVTRKASQRNPIFIDFWSRYYEHRVKLYFKIANNDKTQWKFVHGWIQRIGRLTTCAVKVL